MEESMGGLVRRLVDGPVDVIGDVHGEIGALHALLGQLGYDAQGHHPGGRRAVFVGDLTDRGPDSPGVATLVMDWVERDHAQCVLGNHELNILRREAKSGNAWIIDPARREQRPGGAFAHCRVASEAFASRYFAFIAALPLALERDDLRVVHAAWMPGEVRALREARGGTLEVFHDYERRIESALEMEGLRALAEREKREYREALETHGEVAPPLLQGLAAYDARHQMGNPVRVATSGVERVARQPFWSAGQWRMVDRVPWWEEYAEDTPVIVGHYWRRLVPFAGSGHAAHKPDLFAKAGPTAWLGPGRNVFCVDYSVAARSDRNPAPGNAAHGHLMAVRWPERELWGEDGRVDAGAAA
jgi:hypothetical protein